MTELIELDSRYSTTRSVRKADSADIAAELKAASKPEDQFETLLILPAGESRKGEGGLRTRGYFKQTQDDKPLISLITVVFNGEAHLEETIHSVINQTYDNVEYIVVDGGSTDGTRDIIRKYEGAVDYWVSEKDEGIYDAMNKGIVSALGDIVGFINSDDVLLSDCCTSVATEMRKLPQPGYTCATVELIDKAGEVFGISGSFPREIRYRRRFLEMPCSHQGMFLHRKLYQRLGLFDLSFRLRSDYDLALRLMHERVPDIRIERPIAQFRVGGVSGGFRTWIETFEVHNKNGCPRLLSWYVFFRSLTKTILFYVAPNFIKRNAHKLLRSKNAYR